MSLKSHRGGLIKYQDEKVILSGGSGSENVVVAEERPDSEVVLAKRDMAQVSICLQVLGLENGRGRSKK